MPSISFTVNGEPGPSVFSVLSPGFQLDRAYDQIMEGHGWRRMQYVIDVGFLKLVPLDVAEDGLSIDSAVAWY
jgi:hypothetical protein